MHTLIGEEYVEHSERTRYDVRTRSIGTNASLEICELCTPVYAPRLGIVRIHSAVKYIYTCIGWQNTERAIILYLVSYNDLVLAMNLSRVARTKCDRFVNKR